MRTTLLTKTALASTAIAVIVSAFVAGPVAAAQAELVIIVTPRLVQPAPRRSATRIPGFGTFIVKPRPTTPKE